MFLKILIFTLILMALALLGMMFNIILRKKGRFPEFRVGHNRYMHKKGITCVKQDEIRCYNKELKKAGDCTGCQQPG